MSDSDFVTEPWRIQIPTALMPKPQPPALPAAPPSEPDPITKAIEDRADSFVIERLALKKGIILTSTPKLNGLQDAFKGFTERVEASVQKLMDKMDGTATTTEAAVEKFGSAVDKVAATAKQIDDAANQMTNGGPPLAGS
jgi:hypothetical protein